VICLPFIQYLLRKNLCPSETSVLYRTCHPMKPRESEQCAIIAVNTWLALFFGYLEFLVGPALAYRPVLILHTGEHCWVTYEMSGCGEKVVATTTTKMRQINRRTRRLMRKRDLGWCLSGLCRAWDSIDPAPRISVYCYPCWSF
jgi:hypothetical protein